jgi:DNA repair protein RadC
MIDDLVRGIAESPRFEKYAVQIALVREPTARSHPVLDQPDAVARAFQAMAALDRECLAVALLDTKNRLIGIHAVHIGTPSASLAHAADVFKAAVLTNARSIVLVHNHPSGDPSPSPDDVATTRRLRDAGRILGIEVLDHVVVGTDGHVSLRDRGVL